MIKEVLYRKDTGLIVVCKDQGWNWSVKERSLPFGIAIIDLPSECVDDICLNGIPISDRIKVGSLVIDDVDNPTELIRATEENIDILSGVAG